MHTAFWRRYFLIKYIRNGWWTKGSQRQWKTKRKKYSFKQIETRRSWLVLLASLLIGTDVNNSLAMFKLKGQLRLNDIVTLNVWTMLYVVCFWCTDDDWIVFWKTYFLCWHELCKYKCSCRKSLPCGILFRMWKNHIRNKISLTTFRLKSHLCNEFYR